MINLVLAAGYATRLYPLTENFPKPLLPVGAKTILNWLLDDIDQLPEITAHVIISNHKFVNHFKAWKEKQSYAKPIIILDDGSIDNEHRLGAVKDIQFAIDNLNLKEELLVIAGDNVLDFSFDGFLHFAKEKNASCVMCHEEKDLHRQKKTAIIVKDENGKIISFEEKPAEPKGNLAVPPFYLYCKEDVAQIKEAIADDCGTDAPGSLAAWLSRKTCVYAWEMLGKRYDIGDLKSYEYVKRIYSGRT